MEHFVIISGFDINSSGWGNVVAYQLDPGVDADSDGIYWLHIVPPVSGDIKHLSRENKKRSSEA